MRNRFFFIILTTLVLASVGINLVHVRFFKSQRLKLIDKQIAESSSTLLASKEFIQSLQNPTTIEDTISKVLRGNRIGKIFVLRDANNKIVYQSFNVGLLGAELPTQPEWVVAETQNEYARLRNTLIKGKVPLTLQAGLVLDKNFIDWEILDARVVQYVTGIVLALFIASVILTLVLLSPLRLLIEHLNVATSNLTNLKDVEPLPKRLTRYTQGHWARSDEFSSLLSTVQKLIDRINMNYKLTRSWTLQMAHELKTPLAIIRAETEARTSDKQIPLEYSKSVIEEIHQMSGIINEFLDWAELENSRLQKDLHALRIKSVVKTVAARLEKISPGRIRLQLNQDFSVFANPSHLDQLITNLLSNALKFSPVTESVEVTLNGTTLQVEDHGSGMPAEVKERFGEPFNVGSHENDNMVGNGLGLAWVSTVAKLYQWELKVSSSPEGTTFSIRFPEEDGEG